MIWVRPEPMEGPLTPGRDLTYAQEPHVAYEKILVF